MFIRSTVQPAQVSKYIKIYTVSQNNKPRVILPITSPKCWPIFKILSLTDSVINLQQISHLLSHHTLNVLLHYPVKYRCSKNCHAQDLNEASCHAKLSHSKQLLKNSLQWFSIIFYLVHWLKDIQSGHSEIFTVWLYTSAATQKKRYCNKMLLHNDKWSVSHFLPKMLTY